MRIDTLSLNVKKIQRKWYCIDANDFVLGRLASIVAFYLTGKHKVEYSDNFDVGDFVIIINIDKLRVSGKKYFSKLYYSHSGYPGSLRKDLYKKFYLKFPEKVFGKAVKGMLPKNKLSKIWLGKLYLYKGSEHPHNAQKPINLKV